jgi:hypothetical protein
VHEPWTITGLLHEPSLEAISGEINRHDGPQTDSGAVAACALGFVILVASIGCLIGPGTPGRATPAAAAVCSGLFVSALATVGGFILNRNIYNSDNYRYLVFLLVPMAAGFGLLVDRLARSGRAGVAAALVFSGTVAVVFSLDTMLWYQRFGWLDGLRPVRASREEQTLEWLEQHPEIDAIYGSYWDVYRLSFLTGGRVAGVPYPDYPDRFPEIARRFPGNRPRTLISRNVSRGPFNRHLALKEGGRILLEGKRLWIIDWP